MPRELIQVVNRCTARGAGARARRALKVHYLLRHHCLSKEFDLVALKTDRP